MVDDLKMTKSRILGASLALGTTIVYSLPLHKIGQDLEEVAEFCIGGLNKLSTFSRQWIMLHAKSESGHVADPARQVGKAKVIKRSWGAGHCPWSELASRQPRLPCPS